VATFVSIKAKIGENEFSPISFCSIKQSMNSHHEFEISLHKLNETMSESMLEDAKQYLGEQIEIELSYNKDIVENDESNPNLFKGIITSANFTRSDSKGKFLTVRGKSNSILLDGNPNSKAYAEKSLKDIISELQTGYSDADITIDCKPTYSSVIDYIVQYKETNYDFLSRIANKYGQWCYFNGEKLVFGELDKNKDPIKLNIQKEILGFNFDIQICSLNHEGHTYDYLENKKYKKDSASTSVPDLDNFGKVALDKSEKVFKQVDLDPCPDPFISKTEFESTVDTKKVALSKNLVQISGHSDSPYINVGSIIDVARDQSENEDHETDYGKYIVIEVEHNINTSGSYTNHFKAIPDVASLNQYNPNVKQPSVEPQAAVVTEINDPEKLGRVRVRYFWQEEGEQTPWIRILHQHGGKAEGKHHGFYFIPELEDEVLIGFESNNPDRPYVIGSLYHGKKKPEDWADPDNKYKSIRTRSGNQIIFIDDPGKEEIRILNTDKDSPQNEISLSMGSDGVLKIRAENLLDISGKTVKISADEDLTISSGTTTVINVDSTLTVTSQDKTSMKASDFSLESDSAIKLKCVDLKSKSTNTDLSQDAELKVKSKTATYDFMTYALKAKGSYEVDSKATIKISAGATGEFTAKASMKVNASGMAEYSAGGITTVKGAMVKIN